MQRYSISVLTRRPIRIKDHQTVVFCLLTFAITWGFGACVIFFSEPFRALFGELTGFHPLYILGVAALPRAEFTSCRDASGEADRPAMGQNGVTYMAKKVT